MPLQQSVDAILVELDAGLAEEHVREQPAAHADAAMNAPDRELDALRPQRLVPGEHVLVHAVDERAVEVEEEGGLLSRFNHLAIIAEREGRAL